MHIEVRANTASEDIIAIDAFSRAINKTNGERMTKQKFHELLDSLSEEDRKDVIDYLMMTNSEQFE